MRALLRLIACGLTLVLVGTPVWAAACGLACESTGARAAAGASGSSFSQAVSGSRAVSGPAAHQHHHRHQIEGPAAVETPGASASEHTASAPGWAVAAGAPVDCRLDCVDADCDAPGAGLMTAPAERLADLLATVPADGTLAAPAAASPVSRVARALPGHSRPPRSLVAVLRI